MWSMSLFLYLCLNCIECSRNLSLVCCILINFNAISIIFTSTCKFSKCYFAIQLFSFYVLIHFIGTDLLAKKPLTVDNLILLHNLIQFENMMPRFTATVPSCWTEIQQEQQQRRHPQHLQHQGEATQHTRTWKLQPDRYKRGVHSACFFYRYSSNEMLILVLMVQKRNVSVV